MFVDENNGTIKNTIFRGTDSMVAHTNNGTIENCTSGATVKSYYHYYSYNTSHNNYDYYYAGFVGYNYGTIEQCIYRGCVTASTFTSDMSVYDYYAAGFVGWNYGTIEHCYSNATVTGGYGIGFAYSNGSDGTIINCYSKASLSNSRKKYGFGYSNSGKVTDCYYDKDRAGTSSTNKGTPKATLAMKMSSTYTGWDFENVWDIDADINDGYPHLRMENNKPSVVESITFNKQNIYLAPGMEQQLNAKLFPEDTGHKRTWTSSGDAVATVSQTGVVRGVSTGDAEITLTIGECSGSCTVHVVDDLISVNGMSLDRSSLALDKGGEYTLTAALDPANATDKGVSWSSSDPAVASVDAEGKVTAVADGTAVITAVTNDGDFKAECSVSVRTPVKDIKISKT